MGIEELQKLLLGWRWTWEGEISDLGLRTGREEENWDLGLHKLQELLGTDMGKGKVGFES